MEGDYYSGTIIPETRAQAKEYIDYCWDGSGILGRCEPLLKFRVESRRVLSAWTADRQMIDQGVPYVLSYCHGIPAGPDVMDALRDEVDGEDEYNALIAEAYSHLEKAAALLHLHPTLFLGFPESVRNKSVEERWQSLESGASGAWAKLPGIDGENRREAWNRKTLYDHAQGVENHKSGTHSGLIRKSDKRKGGGGRAAKPDTKKLFVRMLWDAWPDALRENNGSWHPKISACEMLNYCGLEEVTANDFHRYADEVKAREKNALRRKNEVPRKD